MTRTLHHFDTLERSLTEAGDRHALWSSQAFADRLTAHLDAVLSSQDVLSLDVFDTLVLRDNSAEISRFVAIGAEMQALAEDRLKRGLGAQEGFLARWLGTRASYRATEAVQGCREGSLTEIQRTASRLLIGSDALTEPFIEVELAHEATRISPNPVLVAYMHRHRARGGRVLLLTDMYMHAPQVADLLTRVGISGDSYDHLISSADTKVSKASGGIFALAEDAMQAGPDRFLHLGDSFRGDVQRPKQHGWRAQHLPLSLADIAERQADHDKSVAMLTETLGYAPDIARPR